MRCAAARGVAENDSACTTTRRRSGRGVQAHSCKSGRRGVLQNQTRRSPHTARAPPPCTRPGALAILGCDKWPSRASPPSHPRSTNEAERFGRSRSEHRARDRWRVPVADIRRVFPRLECFAVAEKSGDRFIDHGRVVRVWCGACQEPIRARRRHADRAERSRDVLGGHVRRGRFLPSCDRRHQHGRRPGEIVGIAGTSPGPSTSTMDVHARADPAAPVKYIRPQ